MGTLTDAEGEFVAQRRRWVQAWRYAGPTLLLLILALPLLVFWQSPLLVDPRRVAQGLTEGSLEAGTLELMALLLPVLFLVLVLVLLLMLAYLHLALRNERRRLEIIEQLRGP